MRAEGTLLAGMSWVVEESRRPARSHQPAGDLHLVMRASPCTTESSLDDDHGPAFSGEVSPHLGRHGDRIRHRGQGAVVGSASTTGMTRSVFA